MTGQKTKEGNGKTPRRPQTTVPGRWGFGVGFLWLLLVLVLPLDSAIQDLRVVGITSTQAVVSYTAPDEQGCKVELSESQTLHPLAHDTDEALFAQASSDQRPGNISSGRSRVVVLGKRSAEQARNGRRYSRALQAGTAHYFQVTCPSATTKGEFRTKTIPAGYTYPDTLPVDPSHPGQYAWPQIPWNDRAAHAVDPQTGLLLRRFKLPLDSYEEGGGAFAAVRPGPAWRTLAASNAPLTVTSTGALQDPVFLDAQAQFFYGGSHDGEGSGLVQFQAYFEAWCDGALCGPLSEEQRTLLVCLTADGVACVTGAQDVVVKPCTGSCGGDGYRISVGGGAPVLSDWAPLGPFDISQAHHRQGTVTRDGAILRWISGNRFSLAWTSGSRVTVNGQEYEVDAVEHEETLKLKGALSGVEEAVPYSGSNFGVLIRKKHPVVAPFTVRAARYKYVVGNGVSWDASGDGENQVSCSEETVVGPEGEPGYHCHVSRVLYWLGRDTGRVVSLGVALLPKRDGPDGWKGIHCNGVFWSGFDPKIFYCEAPSADTDQRVIVRVRYQGNHQDQGPLSVYTPLKECGVNGATQPCWDFANMNPRTLGLDLPSQLKAFHPAAAGFSPAFELYGRQGWHLLLIARNDQATNDLAGFLVVMDETTGKIIGALPSWQTWPLRWTALHGPANLHEEPWIWTPATYFRGPTDGADRWVGNGPYRTTITSGAISEWGDACPSWPSDSPLPPEVWPVGGRCLNVQVSGEPCDPTPGSFRADTVKGLGGSIQIEGLGSEWTPRMDGSQIAINGRLYTFHYSSPTRATISPALQQSYTGAYMLYLEPVGNAKCSSPLESYLQDAEVGDVFCIQPAGTQGSCGLYSQTEFVRLLLKQGNRWTLERAFGAGGKNLAAPSDSFLLAAPGSCSLDKTYPCATAIAYWNYKNDPKGQNSAGETILRTPAGMAGGHSAYNRGLWVASGTEAGCAEVDGQSYTCYEVRRGKLPSLLKSEPAVVSLNPAFAGKVGLGAPNAVDSHPTVPLSTEAGSDVPPEWFLDARPLLGPRQSAPPQAHRLEGDLYRFAAGSLGLRRKALPTLAACGHNVLADLSGPDTVMTGNASQSYTYCYAEKAGECRPGSNTGEVYVNCPQISRPWCQYWGIGSSNSDMRDICIADNGAYTQSITQIRAAPQDQTGARGRVLTHALSRYRWTDVFWNVKTTPDGRWILIRTPWMEGQMSSVLLARAPEWPTDPQPGNAFRPVKLRLEPPTGSGVETATVEFGYTPGFHCTSRREACVQGQGAEYTFASLDPQGVPCANGCEITVQAIPNRILYWRAVYRDSAGQPSAASGPAVAVVP